MGPPCSALGSPPAGDEAEEVEDAGWDLPALRRRFEALAQQPPPPKGLAVLVTTGAMNPAHRGHVELLRAAARRLEGAGYGVAAAYISPTHDGYVQRKTRSIGTIGLSNDFRAELAERTVGPEDPLVMVGRFEVSRTMFVDFPEVCKVLLQTLADERLGAKVFYTCGTDHAKRCGLTRGMRGQIGLVIVPRAGDRPPTEVAPDRVFVSEPTPGEIAEFSSTKVRTAISRGDEGYIERALAPDAARLLLRPTDAEEAKFERDFRLLRTGRPP